VSGVGSDSFDTALAICRTSRVPTQLWWGQERTLFYNDASLSLVGAADRSSWPEMWDRIGSLVDEVFATATPRTVDNVALPADRYASVSLGPIPGADDRVGGVFCTCVETTDPIRHARRLGTLRALALAPADCHEVSETHAAIARVLATNPHDVPAAVLYLAEGDRLRAVEWVGIAPGAAGLPLEAPLDRWPLDRRAIDVQLVGVAPIRDALVVPVRTRNGVAGVFVDASSPHRPLGVCERPVGGGRLWRLPHVSPAVMAMGAGLGER